MFLTIFTLLIWSNWTLAQNCHYPTHAEFSRKVEADLHDKLTKCEKNKVHLTFDDGPHTSFTPKILDDLKLRKVSSTFFITTTHLEGKDKEASSKILKRMSSENHTIASHGYEHNAYDLRMSRDGKVMEKGYTQSERAAQLKKSTDLLVHAAGVGFSDQKNIVFRFPYGRGAMPSKIELQYMQDHGLMNFESLDYSKRIQEYRKQSPALLSLADYGYSHLGWNHDSEDSSFGNGMPSETELIKYISKNIQNLCKTKGAKVALFHDLKEMNTKAIASIVDIGKCLGMKFVGLDEIIKEESLSKGVYLSKADFDRSTTETIQDILRVAAGSGVVECKEDRTTNPVSCYSEYTQKEYQDCEGESSICYHGRWYSKEDPLVVQKCSKRCYSEYTKKYYSNCEGESSICYDGKWLARENEIIKTQCLTK